MNCKQAKAQIALLAGNDLEPVATQEIRRHLDECGGCRQQLQQLRSCLEALQAPAHDALSGEQESLWPQLSVRLAKQAPQRQPHRLNGWAPALTVAAACSIMFWFAARQTSNDGLPAESPMAVSPVNSPGYDRLPDLERFAPRNSDDFSSIMPLSRRGEGTRNMLVPVNEPAQRSIAE